MVRSLGSRVPYGSWAHFDPAFAKYQLIVLLREWFQHPNGALPAYEWNFDDVNPPVHVMAALRVFLIDGGTDREFLERVFQKLLINFTWWLNREDADGNNVFSGGFLGLDNISPVDRSNLPDGRDARAGGRHCLDGVLRAVDAVDRARARRGERRLLGHGDQVPGAVRPRRSGAGAAGSLRRGRRILLRPPRVPLGRVDPGEGEDDLGPAPAAAGRPGLGPRRSRPPKGSGSALLVSGSRGRRPVGHSGPPASARSATRSRC